MDRMPALSIRQPYAKHIMRGTKTIEYRTMPTKHLKRVYVYASKTKGAPEAFQKMRVNPGDLPTGVLVGTVEIIDCTGRKGSYQWHLKRPRRSEES